MSYVVTSGTNQCPRCSKTVYFTEQMTGPGGMWHKACLTCKQCNKRLDSSNLAEKDREAYCQTCHRRMFGPKGYGYGVGAGTLSTEGNPPPQSPVVPPQQEPSPSNSTGDVSATRAAFESIQTEPATKSQEKLSGPTKTISINSEVCSLCDKPVYHVEQVFGPGGLKYHKTCFRCGECKKVLETGTAANKDKSVYCKACYQKLFGPKGYGYAQGASFLTTGQ